VNWLKGKRRWAVLGAPTGWHLIPAFRLAKPDSWWARKYYSPEKMGRARNRFPRFDAKGHRIVEPEDAAAMAVAEP
jgi:hypothetical protein